MGHAPHHPSPFAIRDIRFFTATSPVSQRIADATHDITDIRFFITEIELENGTIGQGYLLAFHYFPRAIVGALRDIAEFVKGYEVFETVKLAQDFAAESEYFGNNGLLKWALGRGQHRDVGRLGQGQRPTGLETVGSQPDGGAGLWIGRLVVLHR